MKRLLVVVVPDGLSKGIVESQVQGVAGMFRTHGFEVLVMSSVNDAGNEKGYVKVSDCLKAGADFVYIRSCIDFFKVFWANLFSFKRAKLIYDFRALLFAEVCYKGGTGWKVWIIRSLERFAYKQADYIHCVSRAMKDELFKSWGKKKVEVVPCCVGSVNLKKRSSSFEVSKFVYVGGASKWQKITEILKFHSRLNGLYPDITLDVYTRDQAVLREILREYNVEAHVRSLPHSELLQTLPNYDFGYLFRDDELMNNVASPVKFLEYTASGVIPVVSEGVGDYSGDVLAKKVGVLVKDISATIEGPADMMRDILSDNETAERLASYTSSHTWSEQKLDY